MGVMEERRRVMLGTPHLKTESSQIVETKNAIRGSAKSLNTSFSCTQNLNGYDKPWLGGEGKNLFDKNTAIIYARAINTVTEKWISYDSQSYAFSCKADTDYTVTIVRSGLPLFRVAYITESVIPVDADVNVYNVQQITTDGSLQIHTGTEATYIIIQVTKGYAEDSLIQIEEGTTASPYEPYENYCPITGYSGVEVVATGKNLMHGLEIGKSYDTDTGEGPMTSSACAMSAKILVDFNKNNHYTLSFDSNGPNAMMLAWDEDGNYVGRSAGSADNPYRVSKTAFSRGANGNRNYDHIKYIAVRWYNAGSRVVGDLATDDTIQLEAGYYKTEYEPFGQIVPVSFPTNAVNIYDYNTATFVTGKNINSSGGIVDNNSYQYLENYIEVQPNTTYSIQYERIGTNTILSVPFYDEDKEFVERQVPIAYGSTLGIKEGTFTTTPTTKYIRFAMNNYQSSRNTVTILNIEPYTNVSYNGTLNLTTGVLSLTSYMYTFDGTEPWTHQWGTTSPNGVMRWNSVPYVPTDNGRFISNFGSYMGVTSANTNRGIYFHLSSQYLNIRNSFVELRNGRTANQVRDEWKAFLAQRYYEGKPLQILVELSSPIEYQLTPQEVMLIKGKNTIWNDIGTSELVYYGH